MELSLESIRPLLPPLFISVAGIVPIMILAEVRKMKKSFQVYLLTLFVILVWSIYLIAQCADMAMPAWRMTMVASFVSTVVLLAAFILSALALSAGSTAKLVTLRMIVSIIALSTMTLGFSLLQLGDKLTILQMPAHILVQERDQKVSGLEIRKSGVDNSIVQDIGSRLDRVDDRLYCSLPDQPISNLTEAQSFDNEIDIDDFRDGIQKLGSLVQSADYLEILNQSGGQDLIDIIRGKQLDQSSLATIGAAVTYANRQIRSRRKVVSQSRNLVRLARY
jgi:hypothetical protein